MSGRIKKFGITIRVSRRSSRRPETQVSHSQSLHLAGSRTAQLMAVKEIIINGLDEADLTARVETAEREINLLRTLSHTNIVSYIKAERHRQEDAIVLNIFLEYIPGGSLSSLIRQVWGGVLVLVLEC